MDRVGVSDLRINCIVGVRPHEREQPQDVLVTVEVDADTAAAAATDALESTVDYSALSRATREVVVAGKFQLIETMAERVAATALAQTGAPAVRVTVKKPGAVEHAAHAMVQIERRSDRQPGGAQTPTIVGVINLSPESRVPGSVVDAADVPHRAQRLLDEGASMVELGARSISEDRAQVDDETERARLTPALEALVSGGVAVAVDTWSEHTARWALDRGAAMVNFTAGAASDELLSHARELGRQLCLLFLPYSDPYAMRAAPAVDYGSAEILAWGAREHRRAQQLGLGGLLLDPNAGIFHPSLSEERKISAQVRAIAAADRLAASGATTLVYLGSKKERSSRLLLGAYIAATRAAYIRTHEPALATAMLAAGRRT